MTLASRRFSKQSPKPVKPGFVEPPDSPAVQPPSRHSSSRLKRVSDATLHRIAYPLSLISSRPSSSATETDNVYKTSTRQSLSSRASRSKRPPPTSRASSSVSTRKTTSGPVPGSGDKVSALPVFGVSQRGYLASLVSLFSDGNGHDQSSSHVATPVSSSTAITDPDSSPSTSTSGKRLGPYEYEVTSPALFRFSPAPGLYVGWPSTVHPPPEALLEFEMETLPLLEREFHAVCNHLGRQGIRITYELRMSGYARPGEDNVTLSPTVWILYRSCTPSVAKALVEELHRAVAEIFYIDRGIEIQEGGGRMELNSDRPLFSIKRHEKDNINLSDGGTLSIHIEDCQDKFSVCGARCCVTIQDESAQVQSLCRIGGLLKVNGKYILGVSTAHAMLDSSAIFKDSFDEPPQGKRPQGQAVDRDAVSSEVQGVSKWHNVTRDAAVDFLGISMNSRGEMAINRSKPNNATDFSLLRLRKMPGHVRNKYVPPRSEEAVSITSTASASASSLDEGPVYILCGGKDVVDGQLIWGTACFNVRGRNFRVRRIQTTKPLSKCIISLPHRSSSLGEYLRGGTDASVSGAWVVRGEVLYGAIVAVYEDEPFALMMTVERLFASIMGSAFSIRSVELWDGEVPEILKAYHAAAVEAGSKDVVRVDTSIPEANIEACINGDAVTSPTEANGSSATSAPEVNPEDEQAQDEHEGIDKKSGVVHADAVSCASCPPTARCDAQAEITPPPSRELELDGDDLVVVAHDAASSSSKSKHRPLVHARTVSKASDVTMSGAVQTPIEDTPDSPERESTELGYESSGGAETYFTPRQSAFPKEQVYLNGINTELVVGQATENLRGGGGSDVTNRRGSGQTVFGRTFHRAEAVENSRENNYGIPPTGLNGRTPLFSRRRSLPVEPSRAAQNSIRSSNQVESIPQEGSSDSTSRAPSSTQASTQETTTTSSTPTGTSAEENVSGIPPYGLGGRPNVFRRMSSGKPFSFKKPQEKEQFNKGNNFGIPPQGL